MTPKLYKPFKSRRKNKKYSVYVLKNNKKTLIHFGDTRYQQFKDKLGEYSQLDHNDPKRRKSYLARHGGAKQTDKNTTSYWATKILW